ncbi:unnamed protein product, partial [Parnassius mnemosyne]
MLINIIRESRNENDWLPSKSSVICSDHFDTEDLYTTKEGRLKVTTYAVPKKLLSSNLQKIQKQQTPTMPTPTPRPTILQESSNVEGVAKAPLTSTTLSTISTQSQVPVFEKVYVKEELIEYCRLCAASDCDGGLLNLQSDDSLKNLVVKMVKRLNTYIDFSQEHLPTTICPACVKALYTAYDFVVGIDQAQITLNNKLIQNDIRQMPGNRNLDNNLNSSSTSLQQISTNEGTEANDFEQKPLPMPSTSVLLPQVSTNNAPATSKIEQPPVIESKLNLPYLLDSVEKRWKYSYDLKKERQKI